MRKGGRTLQPMVAKPVNAPQQYSSETNYVGSSPNIGMYIFFSFLDMFETHQHWIKLCSNTSII